MIRRSAAWPELAVDVQLELQADRLRRRAERLGRRADALRERASEAFKIERDLRCRRVAADLCARLARRESRRLERMTTLRFLALALNVSAEDLRRSLAAVRRRPETV